MKWKASFSLNYHPDIVLDIISVSSTSTNFIKALPTLGTFISTPIASVTISGTSTSSNYQSSFEYISDRYIILDTQDLGTISSCTQKSVTLDLTWSLSGNTGISHSLISDSTSSPPSWISLNSSTGVLSMTTPNLTAAASYQFYVKSEVSGDSNVYQNLVKLTVDKYVYVKPTINDDVKVASYLTQALIALCAILWITTSILNLSSPQALWMIANQFQLMLLLPLTGAFIPEDVVYYFTGEGFLNFNFNFIPTIDSPIGVESKDYFGGDLKLQID